MAPATKPPTAPAPTAHPKQRASAGDGVAATAAVMVAAAAKAASVFFISVSFSIGGGPALSPGRAPGPVRGGVGFATTPPPPSPPIHGLPANSGEIFRRWLR